MSVADCPYEKDPDRFLFALRRHMEELSQWTERVVKGVPHEAPSSVGEKSAGYVNDLPSRGYIDEYIFAKMRRDNVPHAPLSGDAEFLRRVSLDLTGRIPTSTEVRAFVASEDPKKRSNLIQSLAASPQFVDKWTMYFGDLLRNTSADSFVTRFPEGRNAFHNTIKNSVQSRMPYDVFVKRLISTSAANSFETGEINWIVGARTPMGPIQDTFDTLAVRASSQFLGLSQVDCLLCHSGAGHLDKLNVWGTGIERTQAWQLAAFFSRTRLRTVTVSTEPNKYYWTVVEEATGDYRLNTTSGNRTPRQPTPEGEFVRPLYIFSETQTPASSYRAAFAENLVRDRQFARATVNYLWKEMMGLGIVEPADQFDPARLDPGDPPPEGWTIQPSHPELLEALTDDFIRSGYDIPTILTRIADSTSYQLSSRFNGEWKVEYTAYFARKNVRRLWAEEIHDAVTQATGVLGSYTPQGYTTPVQWAMQLPDTREPRGAAATFMNYFLRGDRDQVPRSGQGTILQAMNMMNNTFVTSRVRQSNQASTVYKLTSNSSLSNAQVVEELFLTTLGRYPTSQEMTFGLNAMKAGRTAGAENLQWALLNKIDFLYNY